VTTQRISLKDLAREIPRFGAALVQTQRNAVIMGLQRSIPMLVERSPVDTGAYASSWDMTYDEKHAVIGNYAPYAPVIEYGARPFTPPIGPLLAWAKRVLQDPSQPPDYSPDVWRLAKGVQKKISEEGMEPKFVLTDSLDDIIDNIRAEFLRLK
jgi:hypothetical protein